MKTVIVLPTYNESENIKAITNELLLLPIADTDLQVLIVDDNSPDGTGDIAEALARNQPERVFVLHRYEERGLGRAYLDGFKQALKMVF